MMNIQSLDTFSHEFLILLKTVGSEIPIDNLYLADAHSLVDSIQRDVKTSTYLLSYLPKLKITMISWLCEHHCCTSEVL